jgi:hypothetical protein
VGQHSARYMEPSTWSLRSSAPQPALVRPLTTTACAAARPSRRPQSNWRIFGPGLRPANAPPPISLGHPHPHSHHAHHPHHTHEPSGPGAAARRPSDSGAATAAAGAAAAPAAAPAAPGLGPSSGTPAQAGGVGLARQAGRPVERQQSVFRGEHRSTADFCYRHKSSLSGQGACHGLKVERNQQQSEKGWMPRVCCTVLPLRVAPCLPTLQGAPRPPAPPLPGPSPCVQRGAP